MRRRSLSQLPAPPCRFRAFSTHSINTPSSIDLTEGVHILVGQLATLQLGVAFPITGPNPFDVELIAQVNFRF